MVPACSLQWRRRRSCPQGRLHAVRRMFEEEFCWLEGLLLGRQISSVFLHHVQSREKIVCGLFGEEKGVGGQTLACNSKVFYFFVCQLFFDWWYSVDTFHVPNRLCYSNMYCVRVSQPGDMERVNTKQSLKQELMHRKVKYIAGTCWCLEEQGHQGRRIWCTFATKSWGVQWPLVTVALLGTGKYVSVNIFH